MVVGNGCLALYVVAIIQLCDAGQAFRPADLPTIVEFLEKNFDDSPLDWLFVDLLTKFKVVPFFALYIFYLYFSLFIIFIVSSLLSSVSF